MVEALWLQCQGRVPPWQLPLQRGCPRRLPLPVVLQLGLLCMAAGRGMLAARLSLLAPLVLQYLRLPCLPVLAAVAGEVTLLVTLGTVTVTMRMRSCRLHCLPLQRARGAAALLLQP